MIDLLVKDAAFIVTMDSQRRILKNGAVAVDGGKIQAVGPTAQVEADFPEAREIIHAGGEVVTPGLIDAHLHTTIQFGRGLADNEPIWVFLHDRMYQLEAHLTEEETYVSAVCALLDSVRHGTTCIQDPGSQQPEASARAVADVGSRAILSRSLTDIVGNRSMPGPFDSDPQQAAARGEEFVQKFHGSADGRVRAWFSLRTERMVSDELCQTVAELARKHGVGIITHMASTRDSVQQHQKAFSGLRPIERFDRNGVLEANLMMGHCHWLEPEEYDLLASRDVKVNICPTACLGVGMAGFNRSTHFELLKRGVCVCVGVDSAGVSQSVDVLRAAQYFRVYQDTLDDYRLVTPELILELLTVNGARGLLWEDQIGSLEVGKLADLVIFDTRGPEWTPFHNPVSILANASSGDSVKTVIINGRVILRDGTFVSIDAEKFLRRGREMASQAAERLDLAQYARPRWPIISSENPEP